MARLTDYQKDCIEKATTYLNLIPGENKKQWDKKPSLVCNIIEQFNKSNMPLTLFAERISIDRSTLSQFANGRNVKGIVWQELIDCMNRNSVVLRKTYKNSLGEIQDIILKEIDKKGMIEEENLLLRLKALDYNKNFIERALSNLIKNEKIVLASMGYDVMGYFKCADLEMKKPRQACVSKADPSYYKNLAKNHFKTILIKGISEKNLKSLLKHNGPVFEKELLNLLNKAIVNGELNEVMVQVKEYVPSKLKDKLRRLKTKIPSLVNETLTISENLKNLMSKWKLSTAKAVENQIDSLLMLTE